MKASGEDRELRLRPIGSGRFSRRSVLRLSVGGMALALLLGVAGLLLSPTGRRGPQRALHFFSRREFSVYVSAAEAILPADARAEGAALRVAHGVDEFLASCEPVGVRDLKKLVLVLESALTGLLVSGRPTPFSRLNLQERSVTLEAWRGHRVVLLRTGYFALKRLTLTVYYADERTWPELGYHGPPDLGAFEGGREPLLETQTESAGGGR